MKVDQPKRGANLDRLTPEQRRYRTCAHESGHAVLVYYCNGCINERGITIDSLDSGTCNFRFRVFEQTEEVEGLVSLAGFAAENKWLKKTVAFDWFTLGASKNVPDFIFALMAASRIGIQSGYECYKAASWMRCVAKILKEDDVWRTVIAVADALYESSQLSAEEVEELIPHELRAQLWMRGHQRQNPMEKLFPPGAVVSGKAEAVKHWEDCRRRHLKMLREQRMADKLMR